MVEQKEVGQVEPGPEKVIWFLQARKSIVLAYSKQQEKLRKLLQKMGLVTPV